MLAARCAMATRIPITGFVSGIGKHSVKPLISQQNSTIRLFASESKTGIGRRAKRLSLKERAMAPAGDGAFNAGKAFVAGSSVIGIGALCFYGLGLSRGVGAVDKAMLWPKVVKDRIRNTYMYFGGSIGLTALAAAAVSRSPALLNMMTRRPLVTFGVQIAGLYGASIVCRSIEYSPASPGKHLAWIAYCGIVGSVLAPLAFLGGPLVLRAAWYTAGIAGGLSCVAMCAPSEKFLNMGGPLALGFGVVFAASVGGMFLPATTALGAGLYSISMYGGLVLFSFFLLYDTQRIIKKAESHPTYGVQRFDPVNACLGIYMDTVNIFIRIAILLFNGQKRK